MGNKESALIVQPSAGPMSATSTASRSQTARSRPTDHGSRSSSDLGVEALSSSRDENFNRPKLGDPVVRPLPEQLRGAAAGGSGRPPRVREEAEERNDGRSGLSPYSHASMSREPRPPAGTMTPVTRSPPRHPSEVPPAATAGATYAPYVGAYPSPLQPFQNYLAVGTPLVRYPGVESYSAMLANIGSQFQLAQEQSQLMHQSCIPGGYITLAGPRVPTVLPAASQSDPRDRGVPTRTSALVAPGGQQSRMSVSTPGPRQTIYRTHEVSHGRGELPHQSAGNRLPGVHNVYHENTTNTHTVKVGGTYIPAAPCPTEAGPPRGRKSVVITRPPGPLESSLLPTPSLDAVLGRTYPQHASGPGGIKIELPPPTIGIRIGTKPTNLPHHNMAVVPPLKSNIFMDGGESAKVVSSSLSAPMTCIGETFSSSATTPYVHKPSTRHSLTHSLSENPPSVSHVGPLAKSTRQSRPLARCKSSERHAAPFTEGGGSNGATHRPNDPSNGNPQAAFQVEGRRAAVARVRAAGPKGEPSAPQQPPCPPAHKENNVQSSRPILTAQAPPPMANVPSYFTRGSIIQLANGQLKRVEELQTEDYVSSARLTDGLKVDSSTVSRIEEDAERNVANISFLVGEHNAQVTVEARLDHPFFVYGQGWSSVRPEFSQKCYALDCHALAVGDVCVSLTVMEKVQSPDSRRPPPGPAGATGAPPHRAAITSPERKRQRFQETRTAHFERSLEDDDRPKGTARTIKSLSLDRQRLPAVPEKTAPQAEGVVTDQNRNVVAVSGQAASGYCSKTDVPKEASQERWSQPPKRRWSDPIRCPQAEAGRSKEALPSQQPPSSLAKLTEESRSDLNI